MVLNMFEGARDVTLERVESNVTTDKTGEAIHMPAIKVCNVLVETRGLDGDVTLSIRFEESEDGQSFEEIGTFPIPFQRHGILFAKRKDYVRYTLIVGGSEPSLDVTVKF